MKKIVLAIVLMIGAVAGCSKDKTEEKHPSMGEMIDVTIEMPDTANLSEEVIIQATVTQGSDKVDDANEVKFEIVKDGQENSEMIEAENEGAGVYSIKKTFAEDGKYVVTAHVTARSMHSMPNKEIIVGTVNEAEAHSEENNGPAGDHDSHSSHHDQGIEVEANEQDTFTMNSDSTLKTLIKYEGQPLVGAKIGYEITLHGENKATWIDAVEDGEGYYSASIKFDRAGTYHIQVHVNKGELHEHKVVMIQVK